MASKVSPAGTKPESVAESWSEQSEPQRGTIARDAESAPPRGEWEHAIGLWLRWNDAYERLTAQMFDARQDQARLESLLDSLDRLRQEAIAASRKLLG